MIRQSQHAHQTFFSLLSVVPFSPYNPPCTTLFIARLDQLSNEELYSLLVNSFGETLTGSKFMVDSKGQRIGQSSSLATRPRDCSIAGLELASDFRCSFLVLCV